MLVAHLLGGNEIKGFKHGIVYVNGEKLEADYHELQSVCGNISLGDLNTNKGEKEIQQDYIELVREYDEDLGEDFVINNHLTLAVSFSSYELDVENKTLILNINAY